MLNKTQKAKDVKTESALNRLWLLSIITALLFLAIFFSFHKPSLSVGNKTYNLLLANTISEQEKGLGGQMSLPEDEAMLFTFKTPQIQCIWMKDMRFSIDVIWLSSQKQVQFIQSKMSPITYPKTFCPNYPTKYVIEFNSGEATSDKIMIGQQLNF